MCSESGLPDDPSWGRLGYTRWLDTAQDLCHSKAMHPINHTDFKKYGCERLQWDMETEGDAVRFDVLTTADTVS